MNIRPFREKDAIFVKGLAKEALPGHMDWENLHGNDTVRCLIGELEEIPVGFVVFSLPRPHAEILHIAIERDMRKKGHGKAMMEHVLQHCRREGVTTVTLEMKKSDRDLRRFYEHCGFTAVTTRKNYYRTGEDALLMVKSLEKEMGS